MKLKVVSRGVVSVSLPLPNPGTDDTPPPPPPLPLPVSYHDNINNQEFIKKEVPDEEQGLVLALFTPDLTKSNPSTSTTTPSQVSLSYMLIVMYVSVCIMSVCFFMYCLLIVWIWFVGFSVSQLSSPGTSMISNFLSRLKERLSFRRNLSL